MSLNSSYRENGSIVITSGDRLTIENASEFSRLLREALEAAPSVIVEFDPQVTLDITGIQLLCSACRTAASSGKSFTYQGLQPHGLAEMIASCGAERHAVCKHNNDSTCIWFGGAK